MRFILPLITMFLISSCSMNQWIPLAKHKHTEPKPFGVRVDDMGREQPMGWANVFSLATEMGAPGFAGAGGGIMGLLYALSQSRKRRHHEKVAKEVVRANHRYSETLDKDERAEFKEVQHRSHASAGMAESVGEIVRETRDPDASTK